MEIKNDWKEFAMELWGLSVSTWDPIPERAGTLPEPLEYDTIHDGLVELETGERCLVIQTVSGYQVVFRFPLSTPLFAISLQDKGVGQSFSCALIQACMQAGKTSAEDLISTIRTLATKSETFKSIFDDGCDNECSDIEDT